MTKSMELEKENIKDRRQNTKQAHQGQNGSLKYYGNHQIKQYFGVFRCIQPV